MPALHKKLAIYVHWPFCLSKCPYCDFNSHVRDEIDERIWADALVRELDYYRELTGPRIIESIFFGGGTPSLMSADTVGTILTRISQNWTISEGVEISLEANPTSVEAHKFKEFSAAGINRVSLGIQALNDTDLRALGREHSVKDARQAIDLSQKYFNRSSFDLIYARMGQTVGNWEQELKQALDMSVGHLSLYQLTIERGTAFYQAYNKGKIILPDEDVSADMYALTGQICGEYNIPAYEISNYAQGGQESRHNLTYWRYEDYIGVGAGAHGRLTIEGDLYALNQYRSPEKWLEMVTKNGHATDGRGILSTKSKVEEMIMMGLRLNRGILLTDFEKRIGHKIDNFIDQVYFQRLLELGYMERDDHHVRATSRGLPLLNSLLHRILVP